jgi:hypothetical protein
MATMSDRTIEARSRLAVPSHVLSRKAAGETVLLNLDSEEYYGLDGVGDRLWGLLEGGTTFGHVIAALLDDYEVERAVLEADVSALLADLADSGLVLIDAA